MDEDLARIIGENIRTRRRGRELTLSHLATHLGVSYQQVQKYEKGVNRISSSHLVVLAKLFSCSTDDLCGLSSISTSAETEKLLHYFNRVPSPIVREKLLGIVAEIAGAAGAAR